MKKSKKSILKTWIIFGLKISPFLGTTILYGQLNSATDPDILTVLESKDSVRSVESGIPDLTKTKGFPVLDCTFSDGNCEFPKNRFLAKSDQDNYFVVDSNFRVIISASDSIIAFSYNALIEESPCDVSCSPSYRGKKKIYYQAIRDGHTSLYDYNGKVITTVPYSGEIFEASYNIEANSTFWITINCYCDSMKMGLIDSTGKEILEQTLITERFISQFDYNFNHLWNLRYVNPARDELIDANSGEIILLYNSLNSYRYEYGIVVFELNGKYGIFHPITGVLAEPNFDKIESIDNTTGSYLLYKGKKAKKWAVNQEIIEYYTQQ